MDVEIINVSRRFQLKNMGVIALRDISVLFPSGKVSIVYGPSGSGKSVLLNLIAGFDRPDNGSILIGGVDITSLSWGEMNDFRRRYISYCMQRNVLIPRFKVGLNIALPLIIRGVSYDEALERAHDIAKELDIEYTFDRPAYTLSGGEQRRVVLARALIMDLDIVLLDEPTSNLDEETAEMVREIILKHYRERRRTMIISTHDPGFKDVGHVRLKLKQGRISKLEMD